MKKIFKYIVFVFMAVILVLAAGGQALAVLPIAPVLTVTENPSPIFPASTRLPDQGYVLKDDTNYKFYYAGNDFASINLATSSDGITWTPYAGNPVLADAGQEEHADVHFYSAGFAGANSGTNPSSATMYYRMWYQGPQGVGIACLRYAESPNGINWYNLMTVTQDPAHLVFNPGTPTNYGIADAVYTPGASNTGTDWTFRIYVNTQWEIAPYGGDELVVMAFSANGYNWIGYDPTSVGYATPVFAGTLDGVSFDTDHISWFKVIKNSDTDWEAFYGAGKGSSYVALNGIGYATSTDGINWTRRQTLFTTNDPVAWRSQSVWMPSVVKSGNNYKIFFLGSNDPMTDASWIWWKLGEADLTPVSAPGGGGSYAYYTIIASAGANGSISPSGSISLGYGNSQTFTITPAAGYQVADVLVDGNSAGAVTTYTFSNINYTSGHHTISATFSAVTEIPPASVILPQGCTSTSGYSITTGLPCSGTNQVTFPDGCTSTSGYSVTTGLPCSGTATATPVTPAPTPTSTVCNPYMTKYIKLGAVNDPVEVAKLQMFLINYEGFTNLSVTGIYDNATYNAVKTFQLKYTADILAPWGDTIPTGYVYTTTIKKINELYCQAQPGNQPSNVSNVFTQPLSFGSNGSQVILLQDTLKKMGFFPQSVASNGNFGPTTLKAVQDFQVYYNIAKPGDFGYGNVGPKTRKKLNELISR